MKFLTTALGFASAASAHTLFTTLFVNGDNQGDGTCIRQRKDWAEATHPVYPITGDAMACGMCVINMEPTAMNAYNGASRLISFW